MSGRKTEETLRTAKRIERMHLSALGFTPMPERLPEPNDEDGEYENSEEEDGSNHG